MNLIRAFPHISAHAIAIEIRTGRDQSILSSSNDDPGSMIATSENLLKYILLRIRLMVGDYFSHLRD